MKRLTREDLVNLGVTDVTEDGKVYVNGKEKKISVAVRRHPYGEDKSYLVVPLCDKSRKRYIHCSKERKVRGGVREFTSWVYETVTVPLARLMLAWFNGSIEADEDADHIDNDPLNNHIDNLQPLSRRENLAKRFIDNPDARHNQHSY